MALFENFPYTNFHEMNLDYLLKRIKEVEALIVAGSVIDVEANVSGNWISQKDAAGIVHLPAGDHNTIGGLKYESTADTEEPFIALSNGGAWEKVPALDANDKIDASLLPPTTDVLMNNNGVWVSVVDGNGDAEIAKATPTLYGTVKVESSNDLGARKMKIHADGQYDALPTLDANDQIAASAIPDTGVTAGTYGTTPLNTTDKSYYVIWGAQVDSAGRITAIHQNPVPLMRSEYTTIAAGNYTQSIYFDSTNYPWYNTGCFLNVNVYELTTTGKGAPMLKALVHGTDYNYSINDNSPSIDVTVTLTAAKSNPVYVVVNGSYGRASM